MAASPANNRTSGEKADAPVRPTKLFIGGLSRRTTTKQLRDHFSKYGRILDCIAMRQPDGRPRGFGYVTLDSPTAAAMCLREPQNIDDRIVDLKPAVPDCFSDKARMMPPYPNMIPPYSHHPYDPYGLDPSMGMADASWWLQERQMIAAQVNCIQLLKASMDTSVPQLPMPSDAHLDCVDLLTSHAQMELMMGLGDPMPEEGAKSATTMTKNKICPSTPLTKKPFSDVTNLLDKDGKYKQQETPEKKLHTVAFDEPMKLHIGCLSAPPGLAGGKLPEVASPIKGDAMTPSTIANSTSGFISDHDSAASTPQSPSALEATSPTTELYDDALDPLPSLGSLQHAAGECRRCNFFAKGRCKNGKECCFCHLPHDRKKLSRQERRDQKAARLGQQGDEFGSDNDEDAEEDTNGDMVKHSLSLITPKLQTSLTLAGVPSPPGLAPPPGLELPPPPKFAMAQSSEKSPSPPQLAMAHSSEKSPVMCTIGTQTTCEMSTQTDDSHMCQRCEDSNAADEVGEDREATASSPTSTGALYAV
eukprot:gnl/TRDRNA2_/TRDRNA2_177154_c0_seq7.p1 gnl/TRDRNA2_/TRDRNA2_177154_c0~~gnl/TRDRNA2_/TRDRNA2_177154_c0_seq7.p1  ORF type:complete len:568 (-),score=125.91 gnl/TRDRNA2_/TRDRNA2_177154_c0_seq7:335-1930(-)